MTSSVRDRAVRAFVTAAALVAPTQLTAHPHIWAEARMELVIENDAVKAMRHVWRFDDIFSATVLVEADANADSELDTAELETIGQVIHESTGEYDFFQFVEANGQKVAMVPPEQIIVNWQEGQLIVLFESQTPQPLALDGDLSFGVYDPTFYTAIDYVTDDRMVTEGLPARCRREVVQPDPDKAIADNSDMLDESFYQTTDFSDLSGILATRLVLTCAPTANG